MTLAVLLLCFCLFLHFANYNSGRYALPHTCLLLFHIALNHKVSLIGRLKIIKNKCYEIKIQNVWFKGQGKIRFSL